MPINKPDKPTVSLPDNFGGVKTAYTESQIENGYLDGVPQVVDGGNINYEKDALFRNNKYLRTIADFIRDMPIGKLLIVDENGRFAYGDVLQKLNCGQLVSSVIPLKDSNLHLLDGSLLSGSGMYSEFVTYIASLVSEYPNIFLTEAQWQAEVSNKGICGKFVYDSANNTVRLPLFGNKITCSENELITVGSSELPKTNQIWGTTTDNTTVSFAVSDANLIDGYYYIAVANSTKTDIEVDIDQIAADLAQKADKDLSNLTADAQMVIDSQNGTISNCILEIPQNLSISASGTSITLNGGSVCAMTGSSTYTTTTIASGITRDFSNWGNGKYYLVYNGADNITAYNMNTVTSGSSLPETGSSDAHFFLTSNFSIYTWQTDSSSWTKLSTNYSYPLCTFTKNSRGITIDKYSNGNDRIFNGAGFIGHHQFIYPGDKGLKSKGYNTDGTLASDLVNTTSLQIIEMETNASGGVCLDSSGTAYLSDTNARYDEQANMYYRNSSDTNSYLPLTTYTTNSSNIVTSFSCRQPYEGARDLLTDSLQTDVTTLTGYDSTQTQTLKNINGVLTWVTD